jgi:hypothetical protein
MSFALKISYFRHSCLALLACFVGGSKVPASEAIDTSKLSGNIRVTLEKGVWKRWQDRRVYQNLAIDLSCNKGECEPEVWAYSPQFNQDVDHRGTVSIIRHDRFWQLRVKMKIQSNPWQKTPMQDANYVIDLIPYQGKLIGSYRGKLENVKLQGSVKGTLAPRYPNYIPNHKPIEPREHPRLIFRRDELSNLRQKAKTPTGQAILSRLRQTLKKQPIYYEGYVPNGGYYAAGYCFLAAIEEDKEAAKKAWTLVENSMKQPGKRILEHGPIVAGVAMAYDLCYQSWDEEQIKKTTRWLASQALWLIQGDSPTRGWNSNAWSNWSARARSAGGLAALAILDEPKEFFFSPVDVPRLVKLSERHIQRYLITAVGEKGFGTEGDHYTTEPWVLGVLPYLQAYRNVIGKDLVTGSSAAWFLPQYMMRIVNSEGKAAVATYGRHRHYAGSSLFALGLSTVPDKFLPSAMWFFNRYWGKDGDRSFGINSPYEAAYILNAYREDITPENPDRTFGKVLIDEKKGFFVFRDRWQNSNDFVSSIYLKSDPLKASWSFPDVGSFRIWGLGGRWASPGRSERDGEWSDENVVVMPNTRPWHSAQPTFFISKENGSAIVSLRTDNIIARKAPSPLGVGLLRSFAVDYSGSSGAPGLFAVVDRFVGTVDAKAFRDKTWVMNTEGKVTLGDRSFTIEAANGSTMKGTFVTPHKVKLSTQETDSGTQIKATGGNEYFVVMTVQKGKAPPVEISGTGLNAMVRVGKQTVHFGNNRLFLGVF